MQALVLAAGEGKRLGGKVAKPLVIIDGQPLIVRLIRQLQFTGITDILCILGHQAQEIENVLAPLKVKTSTNPRYSTTDNLYSFWIGQRFLTESSIISHADLIVEDDLLRRIAQAEGDIVLPADKSSVDLEAMKIKMIDGRVADLSKQIPAPEAFGESIPLMKFSAPALNELKRTSDDIIRVGSERQYLESAILRVIQESSLEVNVLDVTGCRWAEIDTPSDLERARKLFERPAA